MNDGRRERLNGQNGRGRMAGAEAARTGKSTKTFPSTKILVLELS